MLRFRPCFWTPFCLATCSCGLCGSEVVDKGPYGFLIFEDDLEIVGLLSPFGSAESRGSFHIADAPIFPSMDPCETGRAPEPARARPQRAGESAPMSGEGKGVMSPRAANCGEDRADLGESELVMLATDRFDRNGCLWAKLGGAAAAAYSSIATLRFGDVGLLAGA